MSEYRMRLNEYMIDLMDKDPIKHSEMEKELKWMIPTFGIESTVMQLEEMGEDI
tara:strand:- start:384 stop:545 length:162 start_codon:yes stop_codon:yes gene_type:complete